MPSYSTRFLIAVSAALSFSLVAAASPFDDVNRTADAALGNYQSVYIAPVEVALDPDTRTNIRDIDSPRPVSERDQARRAERLNRDLTRAFGKTFTLADAPGDGVLTVEATLTGLRSTRPTLADQRVNVQLDFSSSVYAGGADFEVRLSEADTVLMEISDKDQSFLNDGRPRIGVWQDADRSFRSFSSKLVRFVRNN